MKIVCEKIHWNALSEEKARVLVRVSVNSAATGHQFSLNCEWVDSYYSSLWFRLLHGSS
jgi:hypothetical protein